MKDEIRRIPASHIIAVLGGLVFHEVFHYAAARLLGLQSTLHLNYVSTKRPENVDWRAFIVTLAPAVAAIVLNGWGAWRFVSHGLWFVLPIIAVNLLGWLLMCWQDFYDVIYMLRHREFCSRLAPPLPLFHQRWWDERKLKQETNGTQTELQRATE